MNLTLWGAVAVPGLVGILLMALPDRPSRLSVWAGLLAVLAAAATLVLAAGVSFARPGSRPVTGVALGVDGLTAVALLTAAVLTLLAVAAAVSSFAVRDAGALLVSCGALALTVCATTMPPLVAGVVVLAVVVAIRTGWRRSWQLAVVLPGVALLLVGGTALSVDGIPATVGGLLVVGGLTAQFPASGWLRGAVTAGPAAVLTQCTGVTLAGGYLALRLTPSPVALVVVGAVTAVLLGVVALGAADLRIVLAASTAATLGVVLVAAGSGAILGGAVVLAGHAVVKALLVLVVGWWGAGGLRGALYRSRLLGVVFVVAVLGLAGMAPLSLWAGAATVLASASVPAYVVVVLAIALSALVAGKALGVVGRRGAGPAPSWLDAGTWFPLLLVALGSVALGAPAFPVVAGWLDGTVGSAGESRPAVLDIVLVAGVSAVALLLGLAVPDRLSTGRWTRHLWLAASGALPVRPAPVVEVVGASNGADTPTTSTPAIPPPPGPRPAVPVSPPSGPPAPAGSPGVAVPRPAGPPPAGSPVSPGSAAAPSGAPPGPPGVAGPRPAGPPPAGSPPAPSGPPPGAPPAQRPPVSAPPANEQRPAVGRATPVPPPRGPEPGSPRPSTFRRFADPEQRAYVQIVLGLTASTILMVLLRLSALPPVA